MRIVLDGQKVPVTVRVSRDVLLILKGLAQPLHWRLHYDTAQEIAYIYSPAYTPPATAERPADLPEPASNRLLGKVICLDAGHGGSDTGATGPAGTLEKDHTLAITLLLAGLLEQNGATVVLTRTADHTVEADSRLEIAHDANADIFISIHNDFFTSNTAAGTVTYYYSGTQSLCLAAAVQAALSAELNIRYRAPRFASLYLLRYCRLPAVLIEAAFISNPEEEVLLASASGRSKIADSIFHGIANFFKA